MLAKKTRRRRARTNTSVREDKEQASTNEGLINDLIKSSKRADCDAGATSAPPNTSSRCSPNNHAIGVRVINYSIAYRHMEKRGSKET